MRLTPELLREISKLPPSELWSVDDSSVAYLGTDGLIYAIHIGEPVAGRPKDHELGSLLCWELSVAA
jgi:hypothetical protein